MEKAFHSGYSFELKFFFRSIKTFDNEKIIFCHSGCSFYQPWQQQYRKKQELRGNFFMEAAIADHIGKVVLHGVVSPARGLLFTVCN